MLHQVCTRRVTSHIPYVYVLQCVAQCGFVLQEDKSRRIHSMCMGCSVLQRVALCCRKTSHVAYTYMCMCCSVLQMCCRGLLCVAGRRVTSRIQYVYVLQCVAEGCFVLQEDESHRIYLMCMGCSVLQCVAVCCSVLLCVAGRRVTSHIHICVCVAVCCSLLQCVAECCFVLQEDESRRIYLYVYVLQCVAVCCSVLQCVAECCFVLQEDELHRIYLYVYVLQCFAVLCSVLQCVAVCCLVSLCVAGRQVTLHIFQDVLQCVAVCYSAVKSVAVCCFVLQEDESR